MAARADPIVAPRPFRKCVFTAAQLWSTLGWVWTLIIQHLALKRNLQPRNTKKGQQKNKQKEKPIKIRVCVWGGGGGDSCIFTTLIFTITIIQQRYSCSNITHNTIWSTTRTHTLFGNHVGGLLGFVPSSTMIGGVAASKRRKFSRNQSVYYTKILRQGFGYKRIKMI